MYVTRHLPCLLRRTPQCGDEDSTRTLCGFAGEFSNFSNPDTNCTHRCRALQTCSTSALRLLSGPMLQARIQILEIPQCNESESIAVSGLLTEEFICCLPSILGLERPEKAGWFSRPKGWPKAEGVGSPVSRMQPSCPVLQLRNHLISNNLIFSFSINTNISKYPKQ